MDVIVLDSQVVKLLNGRLESIERHLMKLAEENAKLKSDRWLSSADAASYIGVSIKTLEKYQTEIGYSQFGNKDKRFKLSSIDLWLQRHYVKK